MKLTKTQKKIVAELEKLVMQRLTLKQIQNKIQDIFNNPYIDIEDTTDGKCPDDLSDYNLMFENAIQGELYGDFDIYYLKTREPGILYITEIGHEFS